MSNPHLFPALAATLALTFGGTTLAQDQPEVMEADGIRYVSGGIGDESQAAMQAMADDFNLHVTSAVEEGNYLADVQMQIMDSGGDTILNLDSVEPLFYADLPTGSYTVMASGFGQNYEERVQVSPNTSANVVFYWNTPGEEGILEEASPDDEGMMGN